MAKALKQTGDTPPQNPKVTTTRRPRAARDRLNFRIDARIKARAEDAASILGQDLSTFAESALDEKAQAIIEREERLTMSARDFARFVEAIENPAPASDRLRAAAQQYKQGRAERPELNW